MRRAAVLLLALLLAGLLPASAGRAAAAAAPIDGQTYESPSFGYRLDWDSSWLVTDVVTEGETDTLVLSNGLAFVEFSASPGFDGSAAACLADYETALGFDDGRGDVQPFTDGVEAGVAADDATARAAFSYTLAFDGDALEIVEEIVCQRLLGGAAMLRIVAQTELADYGAVQPAIDELKAGLALPSPGEPGPVFAAGRWRIAVAAAVRAPAVPELRLNESDGRAWVVLVADITNWGEGGAAFVPDDATLAFADGSRPGTLAPRSTAAVARRLDIAPEDAEEGVVIDQDETARVALVFRIPAEADGPALALGEERLPLADALATEVDLAALPDPVGPPELERVEVEDVPDGGSLEVTTADGDEQAVRLIGVDAPTGDECFAEEAARRLEDVAGRRVWLEWQTPLDDGGGFYVWVEDDEGSRVLVNHDLIAGGYAGALDDEGRFRAWLTASTAAAEADAAGLWAACTGLHGEELPITPATPAAFGPGIRT